MLQAPIMENSTDNWDISDYNLINTSDIHVSEDNSTMCQMQLEATPKFVLAQKVLFSLELLFSIIGLVSNIVFVCRKKTNFLTRLFVYVSVATTLLVGLSLVWILEPCSNPHIIYRYINLGELTYIAWISSVLSLTAHSILLWKLCAQTCSCCMRRQPCCVNRTPKQQVILEVVLVLVTIGLPIPLVLGIVGVEFENLVSPTVITIILDSIGGPIIYVAFPAGMLLTLIGYVILLVWFCARRKLIARRRCAVLFVKELVMWFMYFIVNILDIAYFALYFYVMLSQNYRKEIRIGLIIVTTISALYPYCVLGYMWYSFRTKRVQHAYNQIQVDGTNLVTAHPLTWFSQTTTDAAV